MGLSLVSFAHASDVSISVSLNPAGSFVAKSDAIKVEGHATKSGDNVSAKNITLDLNTLKTGISLRDNHMRDKYFEAAKHPKAVLTEANGRDGKFQGELVIRGVKKQIAGTYEMKGSKFHGKFPAKLSDFAIAPANYMGVGVEDEVEVEVVLDEKPQAPTVKK